MPIKSKAQRRKFAELLVKGEITPETYERWNREAGSAELPERLHPKATKAKRRAATTRRPTRKATTTKKRTAKTSRPKKRRAATASRAKSRRVARAGRTKKRTGSPRKRG